MKVFLRRRSRRSFHPGGRPADWLIYVNGLRSLMVRGSQFTRLQGSFFQSLAEFSLMFRALALAVREFPSSLIRLCVAVSRIDFLIGAVGLEGPYTLLVNWTMDNFFLRLTKMVSSLSSLTSLVVWTCGKRALTCSYVELLPTPSRDWIGQAAMFRQVREIAARSR